MADLILNTLGDYCSPLEPIDADNLGVRAVAEVEKFVVHREGHRPTPLHALTALANRLGVAAVYVKDESFRLGLGSFKALGGGYAVARLVLDHASDYLARAVDSSELGNPDVRAIAGQMTFGCATDGNHGRSVAHAARQVNAKAVIFVHPGVSPVRVAAIRDVGAEVVRVEGNYDDAVAEAARVCANRNWVLLSDTSWPGYERVPSLVMQGYTLIVHEVLRALTRPPTHVFVQAGVGGLAAAIAGHFADVLGDLRPSVIVVEPARAACLYESARVGRAAKIAPGESTIMAMLECYEPSMVAWRVLKHVGDAFMTVDEADAGMAMNCLAHPESGDPEIVAGESGGVGLAGLIKVAANATMRAKIGLTSEARVLVINTEGATDPARYRQLVAVE